MSTGARWSRLCRSRAVRALGVAAVLLAGITWLDNVTGYELELFVLYFAPVAIAAWFAGRRPGIAFALAAALCWYEADRLSGHPYSNAVLIYWETAVRLLSFLAIAWTLAAIREGMRRQEALLGTVSHDLRQPLGVILGQAQLLSVRPGDGQQVATRVASILRSARRMDRTIEDLLDGARASSGRLTLNLELLDLRRWLPDLLESLRDTLDLSRIQLSGAGPEAQPVRADPARLERVMVNLLTNALKYSPPDQRVRVAVLGDGAGWTTIAVSDRGRGLSDEDRRRLFEPFHRGRAARGREGVGLGLVTTAGLVRAHGGRIRVESRPGAGATFLVDLPAAEVPAAGPWRAGLP